MKTTVDIHPAFADIKAFVHRLPSIFETEGETLYDSRNRIKVFALPDGRLINVKRYHAPRGINRLVYSLGIRKPKGRRAFEYPKTLLINGIDTPAPIAYIEERGAMSLLGRSYFVSVQSPLAHTLYEMADAPAGVYIPVARELGAFAARMHQRGILHKDFTPGNILWDATPDGLRFALVDTNRMRFGAVGVRRGLDSMKRLWGPKDFIRRLAESYAEARHADPGKAIQYIMYARERFWKRFMKRHDIKFKPEL